MHIVHRLVDLNFLHVLRTYGTHSSLEWDFAIFYSTGTQSRHKIGAPHHRKKQKEPDLGQKNRSNLFWPMLVSQPKMPYHAFPTIGSVYFHLSIHRDPPKFLVNWVLVCSSNSLIQGKPEFFVWNLGLKCLKLSWKATNFQPRKLRKTWNYEILYLKSQ